MMFSIAGLHFPGDQTFLVMSWLEPEGVQNIKRYIKHQFMPNNYYSHNAVAICDVIRLIITFTTILFCIVGLSTKYLQHVTYDDYARHHVLTC